MEKKNLYILIGLLILVFALGLLINNINDTYTGQAVFTNTDCDDIYLESGYGMIAYWTLDDADVDGSSVLDVYGDNDGTNYGAQTGYGSIVEEGLEFDGSSRDYNYVEVADSDALDIINGSMTLATWIYPYECGAGQGGESTLISKTSAYYFNLESDCKLSFRKYGLNNPGPYYSSNTIPSGTGWIHVAVVYNPDHEHNPGSGSIDFYINGVLDASHGSVGGAGDQSSYAVTFGSYTTTTGGLQGVMDEVAIFNRNLTSQEIFKMYWEGLADTHYCQVGDIGTGTEGDPYEVTNCMQLQAMENDLDAYYELVNNIDCSDTVNWNWDGGKYNGFDPIGSDSARFSGGLDGNNYVISNLHINRNTNNYIGLFGFTEGSTISNVGLEDVDITGNYYVGSLIGLALRTTIDNCYATGDVTARSDNVGGLVGRLTTSWETLKNSYAEVDVNGRDYVGGLVGYSDQDTISNCYATGDVTGRTFVGGLVGYSWYDEIHNSYATGDATGNVNYVGGLVGYNYRSIINTTYATGTATGGLEGIGGLVGYDYNGVINDSYATGNASYGMRSGGLIGYALNSFIDRCYATGDATGTERVGGLIGEVYYSDIDSSFATGGVGGGSNWGVGDHIGKLIGIYYYNEVYDGHYFTNTGYGLNVDCIGTDDGGENPDCTGHAEESYFYDIGNRPMGITAGYGVDPIWDFTNVWDDIYDDEGYPVLRMQGLTEETPAGGDTGGTSGGGADEEAEEEIIVLTLDEFEEGEYSDLEEGDEIEFTVTNPDTGSTETHRLRILKIDLDKKEVTILISSDPITATLKLGESKRVDVNNDGKADVLVIFVSLINGKARIFTQDIVQKEVVEESTPVPISEPEKPAPVIKEKKSIAWVVYLFVTIIIIAGVAILIAWKPIQEERRVREFRRKALGKR